MGKLGNRVFSAQSDVDLTAQEDENDEGKGERNRSGFGPRVARHDDEGEDDTACTKEGAGKDQHWKRRHRSGHKRYDKEFEDAVLLFKERAEEEDKGQIVSKVTWVLVAQNMAKDAQVAQWICEAHAIADTEDV